MSVIAARGGLISQHTSAIDTGGTSDTSLASTGLHTRDRLAAAWQQILDRKLIEYGKQASHPNDDDEFMRPTVAAVRRSIEQVESLINEEIPPPDRVAPTGDGGVCFEWEIGSHLVHAEFFVDGSGEALLFDGAKLVRRELFE